MKGNIEERACELAAYIIENRATVRAAAKKFGISKSTVHTDVVKGNGAPQGPPGKKIAPDAKASGAAGLRSRCFHSGPDRLFSSRRQ